MRCLTARGIDISGEVVVAVSRLSESKAVCGRLLQAVLCRLEGAEELAASDAGAERVRARLPGEVLVAAPGPRTDPADPSVAIVLYDTSTQRDLNLNKEIVHDFCIAAAFTLTQVLHTPYLMPHLKLL